MCFDRKFTRNARGIGSYARAKVAKENIYCYKKVHVDEVGSSTATSAIMTFDYKDGGRYRTTLDIDSGSINRGFHSYKTIRQIENFISNRKGSVAMICMIPKGATYHENDNEYCSDKLKVLKILS